MTPNKPQSPTNGEEKYYRTHNITCLESNDTLCTHLSDLLRQSHLALLEQMIVENGGRKKPESKIEDCEVCGEQGYGKAWYGKGKPNDPYGYGDAYYPTGSVVFCKECSPSFEIGKERDGEQIWKKTSDRDEFADQRLRAITKTVNKEHNSALDLINTDLRAKIEELKKAPTVSEGQ